MSDLSPIVIADVANQPTVVDSFYPDEHGVSMISFSTIGMTLDLEQIRFKVELSPDRNVWQASTVLWLGIGIELPTDFWVAIVGPVVANYRIRCPVPFFRLRVNFLNDINHLKATIRRLL